MNMCSVFGTMKRSLFGGASYNCRRQEAAWSGHWDVTDDDDDDDDDDQDSLSSSNPHVPPWKFWRKFSIRRSAKNNKKFDWDQFQTNAANNIDGNSPDADDKRLFRRSQSLKPPPKPPRVFLFRSSSISTPRNSVIGGAGDRNSYVMSQAYQTSKSKDSTSIPTAHVAPVRQQNGVAGYPKENKIVTENNNIEIEKPAELKSHPLSDKVDSEINAMNSSMNAGRIKIVTPDLTPRRNLTRRKKSSVDMPEAEKHKLIMQSVSELLCQKLEPSELLDDLYAKQVISSVDVQAFRGHPDRRLVSESIAQLLINGSISQFNAFCEILKNHDNYKEIAVLMSAMIDIYGVISNIPCTPIEEQSSVEEEKTVSFDVGYFNCETGVLKPVVQLEKARGDNKRYSRDSAYFKRCSRLSFHSMSSHDGMNLDDSDLGGKPVISVTISGHPLHGDRSRKLAELIEKYECILELYIGKTQLSGKDLGVLSLSLQKCSNLTTLDLRLNNVGNEGAKMLAIALQKNSSIRQLNLSSTGIDSDGLKHLADALKQNSSVTDLDMSFLDVADSGCISLGNMLKQNKALTKLRLRSANISWIGCGILFEGVQQSKSLIELDLSRNFIGDDGMEMMCRHLNDKSALVDLNLENCGITSAGCTMLSDVILMNKTLQHLDLSVNFIADAGVYKIANALERNKSIKTLGLNMCGITNDGFAKILDILECNPTLTLLKLCYNRLGREHTNPSASSDDLRYRVRIVTSSNPKLKLLLWGNAFDES